MIVAEPLVPGIRLLINALAGTGKTTTCRSVIGKHPDKRILYMVYNKAMQQSAALFASETVTVCTTHALALAYCQSLAPKARYSAWQLPEDCLELYSYWRGECNHLDPAAADLWDDIMDGQLPYPTHEAYYSVFCRAPARTANWIDAAYDLVIVDEAQDTDGGLAAILDGITVPLLLVGDVNQNLYTFRGTVNALALLDNNRAVRFNLTHSFRFGQAVADLANRLVGTTLIGLGHTAVQRGDLAQALAQGPCTWLCRTNMRVVEQARRLTMSIHIAGTVFEQVVKLGSASASSLARKRAVAERIGDEQLLACIDLVLKIPRSELDELRRRCVPATRAQCILCTVHSAKGLEWDRVVVDAEVLRDPTLAYVAVTRAKRWLFY